MDRSFTRSADDEFWTPNGRHRLDAMTRLGARTITALVIPEVAIQYKILALNVEKAHNLREKSLEVIRMYRSMAGGESMPESAYVLEFEEPAFVTLGVCYENNGREKWNTKRTPHPRSLSPHEHMIHAVLARGEGGLFA